MSAGLDYYRKEFTRAESDKACPVYLLKGEELFIMEEMASRIAARFVQEEMKSFNLSVDYGSEIDMGTFVSTARSFPFLSDRRVMIVRELERLRGRWNQLVEYCSRPSESTVLVLLYSTHDENGRKIKPHRDFAALEKSVDKTGRVIAFDKLNDDSLRKWVRSSARKLSVELDEKAIGALLEGAGSNLYDLQNEIEKLGVAFEGMSVSGDDVARVIGTYRIKGIYEMISCIGRGDAASVMEVLAGIINSGAERPSVVVYQLIRHFLALLRIKAGQEVGGYRYRKLKTEAGKLKTREILTWLENLRTAELLMKSTVFPESLLLDGAILHSMNGRLFERDSFGAGAA